MRFRECLIGIGLAEPVAVEGAGSVTPIGDYDKRRISEYNL